MLEAVPEVKEGDAPGTVGGTGTVSGTGTGKPSPRKRRSASMTEGTPAAAAAARATRTPRSGTRSESGGASTTARKSKRVSRTAAVTLEDIPEYQARKLLELGFYIVHIKFQVGEDALKCIQEKKTKMAYSVYSINTCVRWLHASQWIIFGLRLSV